MHCEGTLLASGIGASGPRRQFLASDQVGRPGREFVRFWTWRSSVCVRDLRGERQIFAVEDATGKDGGDIMSPDFG